MPEMTGAQAMYEFLVRQGVEYIFGNPGTSELPLMDVFAERNEIEYVLALHEDSALGIAAGYAEATGKPAVVNLHTNPGLAHALGNLYNAYRAGTPLIVTAGQQDTRSLIDEPLLQADMVEMARQHTKWAWEVKCAAEIPRVLARAFTIAMTPPTAPVFISLPVNFMEARAEFEFPEITKIGSTLQSDPERLNAAAKLLMDAKQPVIIAGDGVARAGAVPQLVAFAELIGAAVHPEPLHSLLGFPTDHRLFAGPLSPAAHQMHAQLQNADVILAIGVYTLAPLVYTGARMIPDTSKLIQLDVNAHELGKNFFAEVAIQADLRSAIEDLSSSIKSMMTPAFSQLVWRRSTLIADRITDGRAKLKEAAVPPKDGEWMPAAFVAKVMREVASDDTLLVDEAVTSTAYVRTLFELSEPGAYLFCKGGSLGYGAPTAVGYKLGRKDRPVICAIGDGSLLYSPQALWTAARYKLGVVFVVFNNTSYAILKGGLLALNGSSVERGIFKGMDITEPEIDFVKMAESMGVAARRVVDASQLQAALVWALTESFHKQQPHLLDVMISRDARSVLR
ncbi:MAG: thiamine pyrophosphate-binding protein [Acidobacteriota bacterium]